MGRYKDDLIREMEERMLKESYFPPLSDEDTDSEKRIFVVDKGKWVTTITYTFDKEGFPIDQRHETRKKS